MPTPIVFVPGLNNTKEVWNSVLNALPNHIASTAVDCPALDSVEAVARHLLEDLPEEFCLVGFSFGGYVALALHALAPERVKALVLLNSSCIADSEAAKTMRQKSIQACKAGKHTQTVDAQIPFIFHPNYLDDAALTNEFKRIANEYGGERMAAHLQACIDRPDRTAALKSVTIPSLILTASEDKLIPPAIQKRALEASPNANYVEITGSGHMLPMEQPIEVANALDKWVSGLTLG